MQLKMLFLTDFFAGNKNQRGEDTRLITNPHYSELTGRNLIKNSLNLQLDGAMQ